MSETQTNAGTPPCVPPAQTAEIAKRVLLWSGLAILALAVVTLVGGAIAGGDKFFQTAQMVFNALLPLLGTWVGTVLAYYFSKQNFETASQSVERMVSLTMDQKLGQMSVEKEMLRPNQITLLQIPDTKTPKDVPLKDVIARFGGNITRLPIVNAQGAILYVVHESGANKFIASRAVAGKSADTATLQDLVDDNILHQWISNIVFVPQSASVAQAKALMEAQQGCQDLVVTQTGSKNEPMLGWMTNVDIGRLSKA